MTIGSNPRLTTECDSNVLADEEVEEVPLPPDGGWGWLIVLSSFMCNLILDGIAYVFGLLLPAMVLTYDSNRATVSWVGSLLCGVYMLAGPLVGGLVNKFGCRPICIFGAILSWASFSLSVMSPNVAVLLLTYGIMGGLGLGMIYLPAIVSVGFYFERRRALATGISVCGSGVGAFVMAPLVSWLVETYDWQATVLVLAGLCLTCAVFGGLMRPLEEVIVPINRRRSSVLTMELPDGTKVPSFGISPNHSFKAIPLIQSVATMEKIAEVVEEEEVYEEAERNEEKGKKKKILFVEGDLLQARREARERRLSERRLSRNMTATYLQPVRQDSFLFSAPSVKSFHGSASVTRLARPMSRKDIFYAGSIKHLNEDEDVHELRTNRDSLISLGRRKSLRPDQMVMTRSFLLVDDNKNRIKEIDTYEEATTTNETNGFLYLLKSMMDPKLLTDKKFLLIGISNFFGFLGFYIPFVYLPSMAGDKDGIEKDEAAFLLSIIGISNTIGRVFTGLISDLACVDSMFVVNVSLVLSSISLFSMPFLDDITSFSVISALFGLFIAAYIALTSIVLVDFCGIENLTSAFGLLVVFRGISSIIGPPLAGVVYELTSSFDISFFLAGSFLMVSALFSISADIVRRCGSSKDQEDFEDNCGDLE